jgi:peptidyl-tRNA hydrolase
MDHLKTKTFKRVRIGISNEQRKQIPTENFVLQRFSPDEEKKLANLLPEISKQI